jgi:hypothetical protein
MLSLKNILAGAASVQPFSARSDYRQILDQVQTRADAEGVATDWMFRQYMLERKIGQCAMTCISLSAIATAVIGATHGWSDWIVAPIALIPSASMVALCLLRSRA